MQTTWAAILSTESNQIVFKEGEDAKFVFIIKSGQLVLNKKVMQLKNKTSDYDLLKRNTYTIQRFNKNCNRAIGGKREYEQQLLLISNGRMLGDYECIKGVPYQTSLICYSPEAQVYIVAKDDFL